MTTADERILIKCPFGHLVTEDEVLEMWGAYMRAKRPGAAGGRPKKLTKCPHCKMVDGARAIRGHMKDCPRRPKLKLTKGSL